MDSAARDRRRAERFRISLAVEFGLGRGVTRDVSASSVFFEMDVHDLGAEISLAPGSPIGFALVFEHREGAFRVPCRGAIVRVEWVHTTRVGIAADILSYRFEE
jgi:hypothetical protein